MSIQSANFSKKNIVYENMISLPGSQNFCPRMVVANAVPIIVIFILWKTDIYSIIGTKYYR